jgi:hypothetical protein
VSGDSFFTLFPTPGRVYVWRNPRKPGSNSGTRGRFFDGLGSNIEVQYSVGPIITLHGRITERKYADRLDNHVHPMIQTLFLNTGVVFQDDATHSHSWNYSVIVLRA